MYLTANIFDRNWGSNSCREGRVITRASVLVLQSLGTAGRDNHFHSRLLLLTTAPSVLLMGSKRSMFEVKRYLALTQSLFHPPQAIHVDGIDLLNDVGGIPKDLSVELLICLLLLLLLNRCQHQLRPELS